MTDIVERLRVTFDEWTPDPTHDARQEAADLITHYREVMGDVEAHVSEQITHVEMRIEDGIEMGASIWRIALGDVAHESRVFLASIRERVGDEATPAGTREG